MHKYITVWIFRQVRRSQNHGISAYDWKWTLDFADGVFGK